MLIMSIITFILTRDKVTNNTVSYLGRYCGFRIFLHREVGCHYSDVIIFNQFPSFNNAASVKTIRKSPQMGISKHSTMAVVRILYKLTFVVDHTRVSPIHWMSARRVIKRIIRSRRKRVSCGNGVRFFCRSLRAVSVF